jgi:hypothetical protein
MTHCGACCWHDSADVISRELILSLTLRPHGLRVHGASGPRHCIDVAGVANCPINVVFKLTSVLRRVLAILLEPPNVVANISALRGVLEKLLGVTRPVLAVLLDVCCVLSNTAVVVRSGDRRERDCRSNGHCSESDNAVDVGGSTWHVFLLMFMGTGRA